LIKEPAVIRLGVKTFLETLFGIYALLIFCIVLPFGFLCQIIVFSFWPEGKAPIVAHRVSRVWARILLIFYFVRTDITGINRINKHQTYIFVSNHQSVLDILLFAVACKNTFRFLSKEELTRIPLLGYVIRRLYITVNRSDRSDRKRSMEIMNRSIEQEISVFICPEGTRNRTNKPILDFKDGAFRLAVFSGKPLAVLTVMNSGKLLSPRYLLRFRPGIIHAVWSEPIDTSGLTEADVPALKEKVKLLMLTHLKKGSV